MKVNPTITWCAALAAIVLLFYWKLFFPSQFTLLDGAEAVRQAYSWFHFWMRSIRAGNPPLWDPYALCGYSFPGEMQTGAFYPLYLLLLFFPLDGNGLLSSMQYNLIILSAHVLAAWFMFALARQFQLSRFAAFVSGFCFSTGGFTGRVAWPHMLQSAIWLPLIFLFLLRAWKASSLQRMALHSLLSGCCLGLSLLAGGLHLAMAQIIVVITALAFAAFQRKGPSEKGDARTNSWSWAAVIAGLILVAAFCAASIQLLPSHLYAEHSIRFLGSTTLPSSQKFPYQYVSESALYPAGVMTVLFPSFEGIGQNEIWTPYIGVFPFALAVIAIGKSWSQAWVRYLGGLIIVTMLYSLAGSSALHGILYALMPWLWMAREATRFVYLAGFALAVLAGFGADLLCSRQESDPFWGTLRRILFWISIGCFMALCLPPLFPKSMGYWTSFSVLLILLSCGLMRFVLAKAPHTASLRVVMGALIFFDLSAFNWLGASKIEADRTNRNELQVLTSMQGAVQFLRTKPQPFRVDILRDPQPNLGDAYGIQNTSGGGVTLEEKFAKVRLDFDLLNVRYFVKPASASDPAPIYQDAFWKIYENPKAFPRSWLIHNVRVEPSDRALFSDLDQGRVDLRQTALLTMQLPRSIQIGAQMPSETVSLRSYFADEMKVAVQTSSAALLVFSELYYPGWCATVNGKETTIFLANGAFRSVLVPPGKSVVELRYRPWPVYIGAFLSTTVFLGTLIMLIWARRTGHAPHRILSAVTAESVLR